MLNSYKWLHNPAYSAPDHHLYKNTPPKTRPKCLEIIHDFIQIFKATPCNREQCNNEYITRHAIAVLGEIQGKKNQAGDPAQFKKPQSHIFIKPQRDTVFFLPDFRFPNPFFHNGRPVASDAFVFATRLKHSMLVAADRIQKSKPDVVSACGTYLGWF